MVLLPEQTAKSPFRAILIPQLDTRTRGIFLLLFLNTLFMKTLTCDLCGVTAEGETFEAWMQALMPHYMQAHADVMNDPKNGKEEQQKWMVDNKARFEAA